MIHQVGQPVVALGKDGQNVSISGFHFLDVVRHFVVQAVLRSDGQGWHGVIDQGDRPVFHFAGRVGFGVDVADLFEFERTLSCDRGVNAPPQIEEVIATVVTPRQRFHIISRFEQLSHVPGQPRQSLDQFPRSSRPQVAPSRSQPHGQQIQQRER